MTVIEGIGDEVLVVLALIGVLTLLFFAWTSTKVSVGRALGNVWLVQMQTFPQRRVLQVVSVDQPLDNSNDHPAVNVGIAAPSDRSSLLPPAAISQSSSLSPIEEEDLSESSVVVGNNSRSPSADDIHDVPPTVEVNSTGPIDNNNGSVVPPTSGLTTIGGDSGDDSRRLNDVIPGGPDVINVNNEKTTGGDDDKLADLGNDPAVLLGLESDSVDICTGLDNTDVTNFSSKPDSSNSESTIIGQSSNSASTDVPSSQPSPLLKDATDGLLGTAMIDDENNEFSSSTTDDGAQIRLKFLDETLRLVRAGLDQTLGEFKRAHFGSDVSSGKVIRLIFNGQLLRDDSRSLASYGLFTDCVVHCHISNTPLSAFGDQRHNAASNLAAQQLLSHNYTSGRSTRADFLRATPMAGGGGVAAGGVPNDGSLEGNLHAHHAHLHHHHHHFNHHYHHNTTADVGVGSTLNLGQYIYTIFGLKFALLWSAWFVFPEYFDFTALFVLFLCSVVYGVMVYASRRQAQMVASPGVGGTGMGSGAAHGLTGNRPVDPVGTGPSGPGQGHIPSP